MQITKNTVVSLSYTLKDGSSNGDIVEVANENEPLVFLYGAGNMLPRFEEHLDKLSTGDLFEFTLSSSEAYGEFMPQAVVDLDKQIFTFDGKLDEELITIGNMIPMRDGDGNVLQGKVVSVDENSVKMDFNHPMAGRDLHFTGKIIDVREASAEEISHGHVHGHGGHHH